MTNTIKPLDEGDTGGRRVMRPPHSLDVIRAIPRQPTPEPTLPTEPTETPTMTHEQLEHPERYIIVPGDLSAGEPDLYVAMERTHYGLAWKDAHRALHQHGAFMLTPIQFIRFLNHVMDNDIHTVHDGNGIPLTERAKRDVLEKILRSDRAEGLDLEFRGDSPPNRFNTQHRIQDSTLSPQSTGTLEPYLYDRRSENLLIRLEDWLDDHTAQGLPKPALRSHAAITSPGALDYIHPDYQGIVQFGTIEGRLTLHCHKSLSGNFANVGVRVAYVKAPATIPMGLG